MRLLYPAGPSVATEQTTNNKQQPPDYRASPDFFVGPIGLFEIWRSANIYIQLSATLGKPDHVHFPAPFPPPQPASCKKKSPSQLRRQERRREEALAKAAKADKAVPSTEDSSQHSEKEVLEKAEAEVMEPFNCDQCGHPASCKEILMKHIAENHKETGTQESEPT